VTRCPREECPRRVHSSRSSCLFNHRGREVAQRRPRGGIMATKITREVLESFLNCKYKGHLKLAGQEGTRSDYEQLLAAARVEVSRRASEKLLARHPKEEVERDLVLAPVTLKRGTAFLLNATLEDERVSLAFDGLKRVPGPSKLGDFHYVPVLFSEGRQIRKQQ